MAPSSNHSPTSPQLTIDKDLIDEIIQVGGMIPELTEDPDGEYVFIEDSEVEYEEPPLDHLTIYDGLLYEERAASTKPIAELQSQLRNRKNSDNAPEPIISSPPTAEEYECLRSFRKISHQLDTEIHPLNAAEMRNGAGNSGIDWATKCNKISSHSDTSREGFGIDDKLECKPHPVWKELVADVKNGTSGATLCEEPLKSDGFSSPGG